MVVAFGNAGAVGVLLQLLLVLPLLLFLLVLVLLLLLFSWCCCCWARGDDEGVGSVGAAPGVAAAAGMEEKMRSVWGSVDREGCFGCREEMAERGEWPGGGLFLGALSLSPPFNKTLLVLNFFLSPFQKVFPPPFFLLCWVLFIEQVGVAFAVAHGSGSRGGWSAIGCYCREIGRAHV